MALPPLRKLHSNDRVVSQLQEATETALRPVLNSEIIAGRIVQATILGGGAQNLVPHQLNRKHLGWIVCSATVFGQWREEPTAQPELYIDVRFDGAFDTDAVLWVF